MGAGSRLLRPFKLTVYQHVKDGLIPIRELLKTGTFSGRGGKEKDPRG